MHTKEKDAGNLSGVCAISQTSRLLKDVELCPGRTADRICVPSDVWNRRIWPVHGSGRVQRMSRAVRPRQGDRRARLRNRDLRRLNRARIEVPPRQRLRGRRQRIWSSPILEAHDIRLRESGPKDGEVVN